MNNRWTIPQLFESLGQNVLQAPNAGNFMRAGTPTPAPRPECSSDNECGLHQECRNGSCWYVNPFLRSIRQTQQRQVSANFTVNGLLTSVGHEFVKGVLWAANPPGYREVMTAVGRPAQPMRWLGSMPFVSVINRINSLWSARPTGGLTQAEAQSFVRDVYVAIASEVPGAQANAANVGVR